MADDVLYWDKNVPADLVPAVQHIRKTFEEADLKCRWTTQAWCYAALHPTEKDKVSETEDYRSALEYVKVCIGPFALRMFQDLFRKGTPSATLKAFFFMYQTAMAVQVKACFKELLEIGIAHSESITGAPIEWAVWHSNAIVGSAAFQTAGWLKGCCDVQPYIPNDTSDENWQWQKWQAPRFVKMQPSLGIPYDASRAWEREDVESSIHLADTFKKYFVISLEAAVKDCAGEAHLTFAKKAVKQDAIPNQKTGDSAVWQQFSSDFSKLADEEKRVNARPLGVMVISDSIDSSDLADWKPHEGCSENFRARFELLASRAGKELGALPVGASPFCYWLHRLYQHLRENRSNLSRRFIIYSSSSVEIPLIESVCEASSTFCARLQRKTLEDNQRTILDRFQDWIENNTVTVSIPAQISDRNRVSLVAESAVTSIPIEFLSSRLQKIALPRGSTAFGSPRSFFDRIAETHGLVWAITKHGLWMAEQPPSAGEYIDANGRQHGKVIALATPETEITPRSKGLLLQYRSEIKKAILMRLTQKPNASDLEICRAIDAEGGVELPANWKNAPGDRLFYDAYCDPLRRSKVEKTITKIRMDLRSRHLLPKR